MSREGIFDKAKKIQRQRLASRAEIAIDPRVEQSLRQIVQNIKKESSASYVQGQDICPVCGGLINYIWSQFHGFIHYACSGKDCLPFPAGGANQRFLEKEIPELSSEKLRTKVENLQTELRREYNEQ